MSILGAGEMVSWFWAPGFDSEHSHGLRLQCPLLPLQAPTHTHTRRVQIYMPTEHPYTWNKICYYCYCSFKWNDCNSGIVVTNTLYFSWKVIASFQSWGIQCWLERPTTVAFCVLSMLGEHYFHTLLAFRISAEKSVLFWWICLCKYVSNFLITFNSISLLLLIYL